MAQTEVVASGAVTGDTASGLTVARLPREWSASRNPWQGLLTHLVRALDATVLILAVFIGPLSWPKVAYLSCLFSILGAARQWRPRIHPRLGNDLPLLFACLTVPTLMVALLAVYDARIQGLIPTALAAVVLVPAGRALANRLTRAIRARGLVADPTLIVGGGSLAVRMARTLQEHPEFGLHPIGFLDRADTRGLPLPVLGDAFQLPSIILQYQVKRVIVAFGAAREREMVPVLRACDSLPVEVYVMPRFFELGVCPDSKDVEELWGLPLVRLRRSALRGRAWQTKRALDLLGSSLLLALTAPLFGAAALAVRLSSPGPILFRQQRVGQLGKVFELLKFRTLRENSDSDSTWTVADDDRRTLAGRVLRRTGLDELPQLINVLRGEMSLVGPRPERPLFVDRFRMTVEGYADRHRVPAGLTGWAQVHGLRGDTSIEDRAVFDNYYVEHWSLWNDVVILARTIPCVLRGDGS